MKFRAMKSRDGVLIRGLKYYFYNRPEDGHITVVDYYGREHNLKVYNRPERTWDDHMGNTPCGDYVNISGERVYLW